MSIAVERGAASATRVARRMALPNQGGTWPQTSRLLPWSVAAFSVMLWLLPFDATELPISLPFDSKLDRFAVGGMVLMWGLVALGAKEAGPRRRPSLVGGAFFVWLVVVVASIVTNVAPLSHDLELKGSLRSLSVVVSFGALFVVVATTMRPQEVRSMLDCNLALACLTALGVIVQYRTGTNWFFKLADYVPGFQVGAPPNATRLNVRAEITGPTGHGLAVGTMLGMLVPYALVRGTDAEGRRRLLYLLAVGLLFAGCVSTQRKTAFLVPLVAIAAVAAYRPRHVVRLLPLGLVLMLALQVAAPGSLSGLRYQLRSTTTSNSTDGRTEDYEAVNPDVLSGLVIGRGYGSYPPLKYRFLDNQFIGIIIGTGFLGLFAYVGLVAAIFLTAHRLARSRSEFASLGVAVAAAAPAYLLTNALFDTIAFRGVTYLLLLLAALLVAAADQSEAAPAG